MKEEGPEKAKFHVISGDDWKRALIAARDRRARKAERIKLPDPDKKPPHTPRPK